MERQLTISFPTLGIPEIKANKGETLAGVCASVGHPLNVICGGTGTCGKCDVIIEENGIRKMVQGCRHQIETDTAIFLSAERIQTQILESGCGDGVHFQPDILIRVLKKKQMASGECGFDFDGLRQALALPELEFADTAVMIAFGELMNMAEVPAFAVVIQGQRILDLIPMTGEKSPHAYGIAFDLGTTTVVGYLYDLEDGTALGTASGINNQIFCGADVISRIRFAGECPENRQRLKQEIVNTVSQLVSELCQNAGIDSNHIYKAVFCGNSCMSHFFWGLNPMRLGRSPFVGIFGEMVRTQGSDLSIGMNTLGEVLFLPLLGGYVGADTTAALLSLPQDDKVRLIIDLGTNGEIALGSQRCYLVASTACGPALEGAGITMGMRGSTGAIEGISLEKGQIVCKIIGGGQALGFCGSGIVDAVAFLLDEGLINTRGQFIPKEQIENTPWSHRFGYEEGEGRYFTFMTAKENAGGLPIILTQWDIRSVQLAKAAIYTGCELLVKAFGISGEELEEIVVAGAFGSYVNFHNAQRIGLFPDFKGVPACTVGNAAGIGVKRCLLSAEETKRCTRIPRITTHIELATDPEFTKEYIKNTRFKEAGGRRT